MDQESISRKKLEDAAMRIQSADNNTFFDPIMEEETIDNKEQIEAALKEGGADKKKLFDAAENNDLSTVRFYLEETLFPLKIIDDNQQTVAHVAAKNGHLDIVKYMAERDPTILAEQDRSKQTVFLLAVDRGSLDIVKYLAENHEKYNAPDFLTVQNAIQGGYLDILKYYFEERKVDVNIRNNLQEPPIFLAIESRHPHIVKYLLQEHNVNLTMVDINKDNILFWTITADDLPLMKHLWDEKMLPINVNWQNRYNDSLLHRAAIFNRTETVEYLVDEKHADLNLIGTDMMTPLHCAACRDNVEICKFLVERGANTQIQDEEDKFAWQLAFDPHLIEYLANVTRRTRRSINQPHSQPIPATYKNSPSMNFAGYLDGAAQTGFIFPFQFPSFLIFAEWMLWKARLIGERRFFTRPSQIQEDESNQIALDAIDTLPTFREP